LPFHKLPFPLSPFAVLPLLHLAFSQVAFSIIAFVSIRLRLNSPPSISPFVLIWQNERRPQNGKKANLERAR
jgi:hypothetical protein